ncbi:MAG TPA: biotin--[acetyl-CoA-carboxylase] ligase, partial [Phycisphaerales bacterium]|nr:biotin--[acetyl-CoA-carboxylase] ligase [Phycisphaerales bacterium]
MGEREALDAWADELQTVIETSNNGGRAIVLRETDSTQDAARRMGANIGDVVVACRQTAGRGRLGRTWSDTADAGVAMTCVSPPAKPERLAIASAVAVALAIASLFQNESEAQIKWPNDVLLKGRKVAGILIEQNEKASHIGIGINVHQRDWPADLAATAISLDQAGARTDRLHVMVAVIRKLREVNAWPDEQIVKAFSARDAMIGAFARFSCNGQQFEGRVLRVDP